MKRTRDRIFAVVCVLIGCQFFAMAADAACSAALQNSLSSRYEPLRARVNALIDQANANRCKSPDLARSIARNQVLPLWQSMMSIEKEALANGCNTGSTEGDVQRGIEQSGNYEPHCPERTQRRDERRMFDQQASQRNNPSLNEQLPPPRPQTRTTVSPRRWLHRARRTLSGRESLSGPLASHLGSGRLRECQ